MDVQARLQALYRRRTLGIKFGLDVERALLAELANPEKAYLSIHVAGTNGKGSVCALLESVLRAAGLRAGLYTSPHLVRFNERFRVDGECIGDDALFEWVRRVDGAAAAVQERTGREATFFEFATAVGFGWFRDRGVNVAVLETGMGGRLDATNVVDPLASVITRVDMDHMEYLGPDIESIAREKAGIIKPGRPVVAGPTDPAALAVLRRVAFERGCEWVDAASCVTVKVRRRALRSQELDVESADTRYGRMSLGLIGPHQLENLATVVAAVETLKRVYGLPITEEHVKEGSRAVNWPARCQVLCESPPVIVDGAHNVNGAGALVKALRAHLGRRPLGFVVGMCGDKDAPGFMKAIARASARLWLVPVPNERSASPERLRTAAAAAGMASEEAPVREALSLATRWALETGGAVCVAGSLFLAGEVLAIHGTLGATDPG